jgi:hypothetical protein
MKKLSNKNIVVYMVLLYFIPTAAGILGSFLGWSFSYRLLQFGIYTQGAIVVSFVLYLLVMFLRRFW